MNLLLVKLFKRVKNVKIIDGMELKCSPKLLIVFPDVEIVKYSMSILEA